MPIRKIATNTTKINIIRDDRQPLLNYKPTEIPAEDKSNASKSIVYKVSQRELGTAIKKHADCFDGNSMKLEELINNRNHARNNILSKNAKSAKTRYKTCC